MTKERGALIEAMARAAHTPYMAYNGISRVHVSNRMPDVLTAISQAGYAVVPVEPTPQMIAKAWDEISKEKRLLGIAKLGPGPAAREVYRAMLSTTPITLKGPDE